jgi:hypothetical protein
MFYFMKTVKSRHMNAPVPSMLLYDYKSVLNLVSYPPSALAECLDVILLISMI